MAQQSSERVGTKAPSGKTGSVCNFNHNENISANNQISSQSANKGGTRPITVGTKPNGSKTGTVTKGVI